MQITAKAHANIALIKYWGKIPSTANLPATSSLSLTLDAFSTQTTVSLGAEKDSLTINNKAIDGTSLTRAENFLKTIRSISGKSEYATVCSKNNFPTASGLASSASGFAALALAATTAYGIPYSLKKLSALAREGSGSAARSILGGYCYLPAGSISNPDECYAQPLKIHNSLSLCMIIAQCAEGQKEISSREAMKITAKSSPFFNAFVTSNEINFQKAQQALTLGDFKTLGECMEHSTLSMHASMLAAQPSIFYLNDVSLSCIKLVKKLRNDGIACYFTIDAGPHVKILCHSQQADIVKHELTNVPGIIKTVTAHPGPPAHIVEL